MTNTTAESTLPDNFTSTEISHKEAIETVIDSLQQNDSAMVHHDDQGYLWKFKYGSVQTYVQLTGETEEDLLIETYGVSTVTN